MPLVKTRIWQFTELAIPLWAVSDKAPVPHEKLVELERRLRRRFDDHAGVSLKLIHDGAWAVFEFHGGINEEDRRRTLPDLKECLPPETTIKWNGSCVETTVHLGGWVETVATFAPNRTRE